MENRDILVIPISVSKTKAPLRRAAILNEAQEKYGKQFPNNNVIVLPYSPGEEFYYPIVIKNY